MFLCSETGVSLVLKFCRVWCLKMGGGGSGYKYLEMGSNGDFDSFHATMSVWADV